MKQLFNFAERIRGLRVSRGWSQAELARRSKMHYVQIHNWENGRYNPTLLTAIRIAKAFNISLSQLVGEEEIKETA